MQKAAHRIRDGLKGRQLAKEPMFCFEYGMKMLYWSSLVYEYGEVGRCRFLSTSTSIRELQFVFQFLIF